MLSEGPASDTAAAARVTDDFDWMRPGADSGAGINLTDLVPDPGGNHEPESGQADDALQAVLDAWRGDRRINDRRRARCPTRNLACYAITVRPDTKATLVGAENVRELTASPSSRASCGAAGPTWTFTTARSDDPGRSAALRGPEASTPPMATRRHGARHRLPVVTGITVLDGIGIDRTVVEFDRAGSSPDAGSRSSACAAQAGTGSAALPVDDQQIARPSTRTKSSSTAPRLHRVVRRPSRPRRRELELDVLDASLEVGAVSRPAGASLGIRRALPLAM